MTQFFNNKQVLMENVSFQDPKALFKYNMYLRILNKIKGEKNEKDISRFLSTNRKGIF